MKLKRKIDKRDILNISALVAFIAFAVWLSFLYAETFGMPENGDIEAYVENFKNFVLSYGNSGIFIMIMLQILQVIVAVIPANIIQFIGGVIYGMGIGMFIGVVGTFIGSAIAFFLSRFFGKGVITLFVSEKALNKFDNALSGRRLSVIAFLLFFLPGLPKDLFPFFFGLTKINPAKFLVLQTLGRIPGMFISTYLGKNILSGNYPLMITVAALTCLSFILVFIFKGKFIKNKQEE